MCSKAFIAIGVVDLPFEFSLSPHSVTSPRHAPPDFRKRSTGELLANKKDVQIKKHGHRAVSVFRLGLDHLQDLLLHPSPSSWRTLTTLMPRFEG